jgi:hypothetical protein
MGKLSFGDTLGNALKYSTVAAGIGAGGYLAARGTSALYSKMTERKRFNKMLEKNPDLKAYPKEEVQEFFTIVHDYSPELTKSPLVAGAFVRKNMEYKDLGVSPASIKELVDISKNISTIRKEHREITTPKFTMGAKIDE